MNTGFTPEALAELSSAIRAAWVGANSSPFLAETVLPADLEARARAALLRVPVSALFLHAPALGVWGVLRSLADSYGTSGIDVYLHIEHYFERDLSDQDSRNSLKSAFRKAARKIGIPVEGNDPTSLFFTPLGPPKTYHENLARAFVATALWLGPPAIEDTAAARHWQRRAVRTYCIGLSRLDAAISFDLSAHCARRFEAWRKGEPPISEHERHLFVAYDRAISAHGRTRGDIVGPPSLLWLNDQLGLEVEKSPYRQSLRKLGDAFPQQVTGGKWFGVTPPWPAKIQWMHQQSVTEVDFAPQDDLLVFDADSGLLIRRVERNTVELEVSCERLIILAASPFLSQDFGPSLPAADPTFQMAWVTGRDLLSFTDRSDLAFLSPRETALWITGQVIGQDGTHVLYDVSGGLHLQLDPEVGGRERILRARLADGDIRYASVVVDASGSCVIPFSALRLDHPGTPQPILFEILAPGSAGNLEERAELSTRSWIWPGVVVSDDGLQSLPRPGNLEIGHSAGLKILENRIEADPGHDEATAILGLSANGKIRAFDLRFRIDRLWHCQVANGTRKLIPQGIVLTLGTENRHDTFRIASSDREADILVFGKRTVRPFFARREWEIGAGEIEEIAPEDDRIALIRKNGRIDVLTRVLRLDNPSGLALREEGPRIVLGMQLPFPCDAVEVCVDCASGQEIRGQVSLGRIPTSISPFPGLSASLDAATSRLEISLDPLCLLGPGRALIGLRRTGQSAYVPLRDSDHRRICLGIAQTRPRQQAVLNDQQKATWLGNLARFLAEPASPHLQGQIRTALDPVYRAIFEDLGRIRMLRRILPALTVQCDEDRTPRNDILGLAPWVLEVPPSAYHSLPQGSSLHGLSRVSAQCPLTERPDPAGETPLAAWLERLAGDANLPAGLAAEDLTHAFRLLRHRLESSDLCNLKDASPVGRIMALIAGAYSENLAALRSYDHKGGGSDAIVRIGANLERLARASALGQTEDHLTQVIYRTGLSRDEVGRVMTLALRAGLEIFVYFRTLWAPLPGPTPRRQDR